MSRPDVLRYYITDRAGLGGSVERLLSSIQRNIAAGVDFIQIREKDLSARALLELTRSAVALAAGSSTKILVNDRVDIALAAAASGVHLRSDAPAARVWRAVVPAKFVIAASCHTIDDIRSAAGADFAVFSPVFPSPGKGPAVGLEGLARAVRAATMPVLALGGVDEDNAPACLSRGSAGIAAIRLFQREDSVRSGA